MSTPIRDSNGNYRDPVGTIFQTPDNKPPAGGTTVTIIENGQTHGGTWMGDVVVKNKS